MNKLNNCTSSFTKNNETYRQQINVKVTELILTPLTCASIINEIIKCLLYQKSQVPYPYNWLKSVVNKKRKQSENDSKPINLTVERHYRTVSTAYNELEELTKCLRNEFINCGDTIKQVLILFGSTIYGPKEAFSIKINGLAKGHSEENHLRNNCKNQYKIMRHILLAEEWTNAMEIAIPPTNMYVMIQKDLRNQQTTDDSFFMPISDKQYSLPLIKNIVVNLSHDENVQSNCCDNLSIFEDFCKEKADEISNTTSQHTKSDKHSDTTRERVNNDSDCDLFWFQAKVVLKGFKECYVNNVSATELW